MNDRPANRIAPAPIRRTIEVNAPIERAFDVFASRMGHWWSKEHSINTTTTLEDVVIEPHSGGRWYEKGADGAECEWGRVIDWDRPRRLVLAWQLNSEWRFDPEFETTVEVTFKEQGGKTIVQFEHRELERFGTEAAAIRDGMDGGWGMLLDAYRVEAERT